MLFGRHCTFLSLPNVAWKIFRLYNTIKHIPWHDHNFIILIKFQGICEGLTYEEIQERFPQEFAWRDQDKFKYRYPHGESYLDLLQRVDSVVQALLTKTEVLVVSHQAVLRCIMAYFMGSRPGKSNGNNLMAGFTLTLIFFPFSLNRGSSVHQRPASHTPCRPIVRLWLQCRDVANESRMRRHISGATEGNYDMHYKSSSYIMNNQYMPT